MTQKYKTMKSSIRSAFYPLEICLIFAFTACNNASDKTEDAQVVADTSSRQTIITDTFAKSHFPDNVSILIPTQYREESTGYPVGVKDKDWYEIYKDKQSGKWMVAKTALKITYSRDECVGENTMVIGSAHKNAALFFTSFEGLTDKIETVAENLPLIPTRPVVVKTGEHSITLNPTGILYSELDEVIKADELKKDEDGNIYIDQITSYELTFAPENGKPYVVYRMDVMQGVTPKVIWAGDLNGDNMPDMILDLSDFYESHHLFFFLSDSNDKEEPLKKVADLKVVNDC